MDTFLRLRAWIQQKQEKIRAQHASFAKTRLFFKKKIN